MVELGYKYGPWAMVRQAGRGEEAGFTCALIAGRFNEKVFPDLDGLQSWL